MLSLHARRDINRKSKAMHANEKHMIIDEEPRGHCYLGTYFQAHIG